MDGENTTTPLVIAHRGASGYRPEHTLEAYQVAIEMGADFIEPDLVITADGVLVARHEAELSSTTDVADRAEFADRKRTAQLDGQDVTGWFVNDFTAAEIATLRARERIAHLRPQSAMYDGQFRVPTITEITQLAAAESLRLGRRIGVYPELKHPGYFAAAGLDHDDALLDAIAAAGLASSQIYIQCFEPSALRRLAGRTSLPLVQLVDQPHGQGCRPPSSGGAPTDLITPAGLDRVAEYAVAVGVHKSLVLPRTSDGLLDSPTDLVRRAHDAGLAVHAWTLRDENTFLPVDHRRGEHPALRGDAAAEYADFRNAGVDGLFTDNPDTAIATLRHAALVSACRAAWSSTPTGRPGRS